MSEILKIIGLMAACIAAAAKFHHWWFVSRRIDESSKDALRSSIGDYRLARSAGLVALWIANTATTSLLFYFYFRHPEYFTPAMDSKYPPEFQVLFLAPLLSLAATFFFEGAIDFIIIKRLNSVECLKAYAFTLRTNRVIFYSSLLVLLGLAFSAI